MYLMPYISHPLPDPRLIPCPLLDQSALAPNGYRNIPSLLTQRAGLLSPRVTLWPSSPTCNSTAPRMLPRLSGAANGAERRATVGYLFTLLGYVKGCHDAFCLVKTAQVDIITKSNSVEKMGMIFQRQSLLQIPLIAKAFYCAPLAFINSTRKQLSFFCNQCKSLLEVRWSFHWGWVRKFAHFNYSVQNCCYAFRLSISKESRQVVFGKFTYFFVIGQAQILHVYDIIKSVVQDNFYDLYLKP